MSRAPDTAVLLAAGKGERLGAITRALPKPLIRIGGEPILEHNIKLCRRHGFTRLLINLHHLPEAIRAHCGDGSRWGVSIEYFHEPELLGTAGAVRNMRPRLGARPFLVLYGDNFIDYDLRDVMSRHAASGADMSLVVFKLKDLRLSGVARMDEEGRLKAFVEKPRATARGGAWVSAGVYALERRVADAIGPGPCDFGRDVIPALIRDGYRLHGIKADRGVKAVDTPERYRRFAAKEPA